MEKTHIEKVKSAIPVYGFAGTWLICCFIFDMTKLSSYFLCIGLSLVTFFVLEKIIPVKEIVVTDPIDLKDERANLFLQEANDYLVELKTLKTTIKNQTMQKEIERVIVSMDEILEFVVTHPTSALQLRKLTSYYLPTLVKLLNSYEEMESNRIQGDNMKTSMQEIETTMEKASIAFEKQLDLLYSNEKIDIISDIQVLETMMSQQGLTKEK